MRNEKAGASGFVWLIAKCAGALVGAAVVVGQKVGLCVRSMLTAKEGPSKQVVEKPVQVQAESKRKGPGPRSGKTRPKAARARVQKKTVKRKRSTPPGGSAVRK